MSRTTDTLRSAAHQAWRAARRTALAIHNGAVWLFEPAWTSLEKQINATDWRPIAAKIVGLMLTLKVGFVAAASEAVKDPMVTEALAMLLGSVFIGFLAALTRFHHGLPRDETPPIIAPTAPPTTTTTGH